MDRGNKIKAGEFALALTWGEANLSEAVGWADSLIGEFDDDVDLLTDVSLASSDAAAVEALNALSNDLEVWDFVPLLLQRISAKPERNLEATSTLASHLEALSMRDNPPKYLSPFFGYWDDIVLARDGVYGDVETVIKDFRDDLQEAAAASMN